jgi:hypothetical protein
MEHVRPFWWVEDVQLRESLEKDYAEVEKCDSHDIDKATMVLCGSVIEGLLYNATKTHWQSADQPDFAKVVQIAHGKKVISDEAEQVCLLMKGWRNRIHSERQLRLGIPPEDLPQRAKIAKAVMEMLILELEKSSDWVFIDDDFRVHIDSQDPSNDKSLSWDSQMMFEGKRSLKVQGEGKDGNPNAWMIWRTDPVRGKRFFKTHVYLNAELAPDELMIQFHQFAPEQESDAWEHRVYWGRDLILFDPSRPFQYPRRRIGGDFPQIGKWTQLAVDLQEDAVLDVDKGIDGLALVLARDPAAKARAAWFGKSVFTSVR